MSSNNLEGVKINLVANSFLVGLGVIKSGAYDEYSRSTDYLAIEIKYDKKERVLSPEDEKEMVNSYIFEVADSIGIALSFSEIGDAETEFEELEEKHKSSSETSRLRDLENYNEGMRLFISAMQIQEAELRFLNFYKILEHFSPIAVNIEANELMRKKLDAPRNSFENGDFIRSIFDLAITTKNRFNDEDLIKSTFLTCFDFVGLFEKLPDSIQKKVKKHISEQIIDYSTDKQKLTTASNIVGKIIYLTRNKVVHAKANYDITGNECISEDLPTLNEFMKEACSQAIRWYNRQPEHNKLTAIK